MNRLSKAKYEPAHEIMALSFLRKLILQTRMRKHPVRLDVWFLVGLFIYFHTSCVRTAMALARLRGCAGSPEPSLVAYVISAIISWAGSYGIFIHCVIYCLQRSPFHTIFTAAGVKCMFRGPKMFPYFITVQIIFPCSLGINKFILCWFVCRAKGSARGRKQWCNFITAHKQTQ